MPLVQLKRKIKSFSLRCLTNTDVSPELRVCVFYSIERTNDCTTSAVVNRWPFGLSPALVRVSECGWLLTFCSHLSRKWTRTRAGLFLLFFFVRTVVICIWEKRDRLKDKEGVCDRHWTDPSCIIYVCETSQALISQCVCQRDSQDQEMHW